MGRNTLIERSAGSPFRHNGGIAANRRRDLQTQRRRKKNPNVRQQEHAQSDLDGVLGCAVSGEAGVEVQDEDVDATADQDCPRTK